tara:strand:+ start:35 stop:445 length:411 start_codon:yes stop_codon:yes gene_type:complete
MTSTLFVAHLTPEETVTLEELHRYHPKPAARRRAHIILLNNRGFSLSKIVTILNLNRQAIALTINKWEKSGICALFDKKRSGRPKTLSPAQETNVIEMVHACPRSLKTVVNEIEKQMGVYIGVSTIKRLCKRAGLS